MAEQGLTDISMNAMKSLVGAPGTTNLRDLCNYSGISPWSFYRPRPITVDGSKQIIMSSPTTNRKLGDFRRYDHAAIQPKPNDDFAVAYSGSTMSLSIIIWLYRLNVKELFGGSTPYLTRDVYLSSTDRANQVNLYDRQTVTINLSAESPPAGHTNNQTEAPTADFQLIIDGTFPTTSLSKPVDTLYVDTFLSNAGGDTIARIPDSYTTVTVTELEDPYVDKTGLFLPTAPPGFTVAFPVITNNNSNHTAIEFAQSVGNTTTGSWYWYIAGLNGATWYRLGSVDVEITMRNTNSVLGFQSDTLLLDGTLPAAGASSNLFSNNLTLDGGDTWALGDVGDLRHTGGAINWAGVTQYALPGSPS